ncbi:MAG: mechanosensitive ion channel [Candidatus Aminicenantes bacterium]|nr:mechanosensitive ion channel [Candidatus Aminicenantes bacterium]
MNAPTIYRDLAVFGAVLLAAGTLSVLFRLLLGRVFRAPGKGWGVLVSRSGGPAVFLAVISAVRALFAVGPEADRYLEAAFFFFAVVLVLRFVDAAVVMIYAGRRRPYPLPDVLRGMIFAAIYLWLFFTILKTMLGLNIGTLLAGSAILTAVLGLALQGVLSNILSGLSLHFTRAFSRGDWVAIGGHEGVVQDTNWRETRLLDRQTNIVVLPNNAVASEKIVNFSRPTRKTALLLVFKISPAAPAGEVYDALLEAAGDCPSVLASPSPQAYATAFDETGLSYTLKFWIEDFARKHPITGEVASLAWYKLRRRGVEVAVSWPDRVGEITGAMEAFRPTAAKAAADDIERTTSILRGSTLLRRFGGERPGELIVAESGLRELAARVRRSPYTKGEILCRQGDKGTSCFLVVRGLIHGQIGYEENGRRFQTEFDIGPGGLFGEMSLFNGLPRTATGRVAEDSELIEILAQDFGRLLAGNPDMTETIAEMISARNAQNKEFLLKIKELSAKEVEDSADKHRVLAYLRKFVAGLWK